jgi:Coenzyme PQQ synthesis protein D (PqqD)
MLLSRADRIYWRGAVGLLILADRYGVVTEVSGSGNEIWEVLSSPIERGDLVARLAARHDLPTSQIAADISPVLDGLIQRGLVVVDR